MASAALGRQGCGHWRIGLTDTADLRDRSKTIVLVITWRLDWRRVLTSGKAQNNDSSSSHPFILHSVRCTRHQAQQEASCSTPFFSTLPPPSSTSPTPLRTTHSHLRSNLPPKSQTPSQHTPPPQQQNSQGKNSPATHQATPPPPPGRRPRTPPPCSATHTFRSPSQTKCARAARTRAQTRQWSRCRSSAARTRRRG